MRDGWPIAAAHRLGALLTPHRFVTKTGLGNHAAATLNQLEVMVRCRLRAIQHRPDLINAFLGQIGLTLDPPP